jgi:arsenate reductase-like glutaredoxin family protein
MSVDKMSASIRQHITSRLKEVISKGTGESITDRKLKSFVEYTSRDQIRKDTDTVGGRHESIMSRGAFESLLQDMSKAIEERELSDELTSAVQQASFDGFVSYISEIYYKDKEFLLADNRRVKNGFIYSGPTRATTESVAVFAKSADADDSYKDVLLLKNIPQGKLVEYYSDYISNGFGELTTETKKQLKKSLQGGHLTGVFTARLVRAFGLRKSSVGTVSFTTNAKQLTDFEKQLGLIVDLVTDADFLSSNIALDIDLFTETDKRLYSNATEVRLTTEVQFAASNKAAGDMLTTAGTYLSKLISSVKPNVSEAGQNQAAQEAFKKMLQNLQKVSAYVKDRATQLKQLETTKKLDPKLQQKLAKILQNQQVFETMITTEGSPSVVQHLATLMANTITGKTTKQSRSTVKLREPAKISGSTLKTKPKVKPKGRAAKPKFKEPQLKLGKTSTSSLIGLQNLINSQLQNVISANMGDGNSRSVLNYRTGRLASSAKVEGISESRAGMITAFYSYMKNPYATFSEGGKQSSPRSRDPKLLISKSIREIAAQQVGNRLRAVNI